MAVAKKSRTSLRIEKCDFNKLVLNKTFYFIVFSCTNLPLTAKYTSEKILLNKLILNFKLQKSRTILVCCSR